MDGRAATRSQGPNSPPWEHPLFPKADSTFLLKAQPELLQVSNLTPETDFCKVPTFLYTPKELWS